MNEDQLKEATAGTIEMRDVNARQVGNGFVLSGSRRFMEQGTNAVRAQLVTEAVAGNSVEAGQMAAAFLATGVFAEALAPA